MHYLYVIYSKSINKYYVGETPDVQMRIEQHKKHYFKTSYTKAAKDWFLVLEYQCDKKDEAVFLEKFIKRMKSRVFIEKIIKSPEIFTEVLVKK